MSSLKRVLDFSAAAVGLIILSPVILLIAIVARLTSSGPVVFRQERLGLDERPFVCYKFRTMYPGTAQRATHEISASAVTPAGGFLRKFKLDELPQLWNVLRGDMSLVGPRPCLPVQEELVTERRKHGVFSVRPGITGLAQVEGIDMSEPKRLAERDADYVRLQSIPLDVSLIFRTVLRP
ncbi:MAG: sugar transferase [Hyphomicrobiaceae bacterium]|nr:sugar transferase [Hyphomicrobiaceae bacterium]